MTEYTKDERTERYFRRVVGMLVFATATLGFFHSKYWLLATMFIGLNLLQYSFSGWCPLVKLLRKLA